MSEAGTIAMSFNNPIAPLDSDWELRWAPYDGPTYRAVLEQLEASDVVIEIGAGDLRLARQMAATSKRVYAVEINTEVLAQGLGSEQALPGNLIPIQADARIMDFPSEVTVAVLIMRHCTHFRLYAEELKAKGCPKLITNARWHMGVETVALQGPRLSFAEVEIGWYACWCGAAGFKSGPVEKLTPAAEAIIHEVMDCPKCLAR